MKRFCFRLQPVLNLRAAHRDAREREVAGLEGEVNEVQDKLKLYRGQLNKLARETVGENPGELINFQYYCESVDKNIKDQSQLLREKVQSVAAARKQLLKAEQEFRSLEIIKEKEQSLYRRLAAQEEQKFLDETGTTGFARSRQNR